MKRNSIFLLILLTTLVFWGFFKPGPKVANDFPYIYSDLLKESFRTPSTWIDKGGEGMGEYGVLTMWSWPIDFLYGLGGTLGLSFEILERVLGGLLIILLGAYSINKFLRRYNIKGSAAFVASLFYLTSTYLILLIDGGQFLIAIAYSFFPLAFVWTSGGVEGSFENKLLGGLAVGLLGFFDIRFVYLLLMLLFFEFIWDLYFVGKKQFKRYFLSWFLSGLVATFVFFGLHVYWILPMFLAKTPSLSTNIMRLTQASSLNFTSLGHAFYLLQPHWYKNVFGKITLLRAEFVLIPILVFLSAILRKSKVVGFWLLVSLISLFLVKGSNQPFGGVYTWLFENIPGFSLFRDSTKFFFLVALSYSVLISFTVDELVKRFNWKLKVKSWKFPIIPLILTSFFIILIRPAWTNKMTGTFSDPVNKEHFFKIKDIIESDASFGRILWIPSRAPLGYSSSVHGVIEASRLLERRPFVIGTVGTYELFNFLREAPFMGELFDIAAIKYIAYPFPDTRREELKLDNIDYYHSFLDQLSNLYWIDSKISDPPVAVLKTKKSQEHFFAVPNTLFIIGSDRIYWDLIDVDGFDLSSNALMFAEEQPGFGARIPGNASVVLYKKESTDLAAAFIDNSNFVFPAANLDFDPDITSGWWKRESADLIRWRAFLQEKYGLDNLDFDYGGGWAVGEGNLQLTIENPQLRENKVLLARLMTSSRGGKVRFLQGDNLIGEVGTKYDSPEKAEIKLTGYGEIPDKYFEYNQADFSWFEVGKLAISNQPLTIKAEGDINVVNAIAALPEGEWKQINELIQGYRIYSWDELGEDEKKELLNASSKDYVVDYKRISPTHYKVKVEGVESPITLAFSETYDPLWRLGDQGSYPLYSLINGFTIAKDGEYEIYFEPQKYVSPGLIISGATLAASMALLVLLRMRNS